MDPFLLDEEDLASWLGEPITEAEDKARAISVLDFAWGLVDTETGQTPEDWEEAGVPRNVRNVVLQVAGRGYANPDSWGNERVDDWGGGGRPVEELGMYLTATEKRMLAPFAKRRSIGVFSGKGVRGSDDQDLGLVPTPDGPPIVWFG